VVLLCYDGSELARRALEGSAAVVADRDATVLTVWESMGSALLRHPFPQHGASIGRDLKEISEEVVAELDEGTASRAEATAAEGVEIARAVGFEAEPLVRRAVARATERDTVTVWRAIVDAAQELDASAVVLGTSGRSGLGSALLGSVSNGVVHHSTRPVLVVPPPG
jgi:nucleotide-binding universal stress UspA family protein